MIEVVLLSTGCLFGGGTTSGEVWAAGTTTSTSVSSAEVGGSTTIDEVVPRVSCSQCTSKSLDMFTVEKVPLRRSREFLRVWGMRVGVDTCAKSRVSVVVTVSTPSLVPPSCFTGWLLGGGVEDCPGVPHSPNLAFTRLRLRWVFNCCTIFWSYVRTAAFSLSFCIIRRK